MKYLIHVMCLAVLSGVLAQTAVAADVPGASPPSAPMTGGKVNKPSIYEGKVVSVLNVDNYSYVEISKGNQKAWIAAPKSVIKVGDSVMFEEGIMMKDFRSTQLQRTFSDVMFVEHVTVVAAGK